MRPVDPRLPRQAAAARAGLLAATGLGLAGTVLVIAQAGLLAAAIAGTTTAPLGALAAVVAARAGVAGLTELVAGRVATATKRQLRLGLVHRAVGLGPVWLARHGTGSLSTLAVRGLDALDGYFARFLPQLVLATTVPMAVVVLLLGVDWPSAVAVAVTVPLIPLFMALVGLHTQARTERQWDSLQRLGGHFLDVVEGLPTLAVFRRAKAQIATVARVTEQNRVATMATLRIAFLSALVLELLATLATAVVAVEVGLRLLHGGVPYETALFVLLLTPEAYLPLRKVGAEYHASREGAVAATRALDVLAEPLPVPGPRPAPDFGTVVLDGVRAGEDGRWALTEASLELSRDERVVLAGPSGAGKSTVLSVLLRFVPLAGGRVLADGVDVSEVDVEDWRRRVAWVPQRPHLTAGTVRDNVRLGAPSATDAELEEAARTACLDRVLAALPGGWDTPVGEHGTRLSSGERQRVALARAFLRVLVEDVPLLVLDEPTAHLDAATAALVRTGVTALAADRIALVVAHDEGWERWADRVVAIEHGRAVTPTRVAVAT